VSIFKNFIQQYQSHGGHSTKNGSIVSGGGQTPNTSMGNTNKRGSNNASQ